MSPKGLTDLIMSLLMHNQGFPQPISVGYFLRDKMGHAWSGIYYHRLYSSKILGKEYS